jgi:hypothetical protein
MMPATGGKPMSRFPARQRIFAFFLGAAVIAVVAGSHYQSVARAQSDVTPGMLFGPLRVGQAQHVELCSTFLSEGSVTQFVHFRNLTTGEVTEPVMKVISSGNGACTTYSGTGQVVGMARGEGPGADWVSTSNALIGTMSVVDNGKGTRATVAGIVKFWKLGL